MVEIEAIFDFYQYYEIESHRIIKDEFNANNFVERLNNPKGEISTKSNEFSLLK